MRAMCKRPDFVTRLLISVNMDACMCICMSIDVVREAILYRGEKASECGGGEWLKY